MLGFHRQNERVDLNRDAFKQLGPDEQVLTLVVSVQERHHPRDVVADDRDLSGVSRGDLAHQARDRLELPPEHVMHHEHVAAVGHGLGLQHRGLLRGISYNNNMFRNGYGRRRRLTTGRMVLTAKG